MLARRHLDLDRPLLLREALARRIGGDRHVCEATVHAFVRALDENAEASAFGVEHFLLHLRAELAREAALAVEVAAGTVGGHHSAEDLAAADRRVHFERHARM